MLKTKIKVSAVTNLTDARYFAAWGVDFLGFCMDRNDANFISPEKVKEIKEWIEGPEIILEYSDVPEISHILDDLAFSEANGVQLDHKTEAAISNMFSDHFLFKNVKDIAKVNPDVQADYLLLSLEKAFNTWDDILLNQIQNACLNYRCFMDIPFSADQIDKVLEEINPYGFVLRGGEEEKVGFKSFEELDDIFDVLMT